ncbi:MAG TPA: hypothetical protein VFZ66_17285 [Herpetosiphonaceae bacterium]
MAKGPRSTSLDFAFFTYLRDFYQQNRGRIRQNYRELTRKYLDHNDPTNAKAYLRQPQFEALEMYVFLKEFLDNKPVHTIFKEWSERTGRFEERSQTAIDYAGQTSFLEQFTTEDYEGVFKHMRSFARSYPNYIFALTMGTGKTILMATCIFYEFLLANKFPKDGKYCHNALVFAPDRTVLEALREIQTFDKALVVPPEYVNWLDAHIRFHFLDEAGMTLNVLDRSRFNLIISNTQKIILKKQHQEKSPLEKLMGSGRPTYDNGSVYEEFADLYDSAPEDEQELSTNQRFEKLQRLGQLGIYVDEAHHAFGSALAQDMGLKQSKTSLRLTIDELARKLQQAKTHVVACYNFTGTPYVEDQILPEVVYAYGLQEAIDKGFLKKVRTHGYTNPKTAEFVSIAIDHFVQHVALEERHEGLLPKIAFFAATIDEVEKELRPAVEAALVRHGISTDKILVNVGDAKLTSNEDIREFNRLDTPGSNKQFILLVNKGREGWNCRSLFAVALYRKPKSRIFVLQASMRCLRSIGGVQHTGHVYLSTENMNILQDELQENFRVSIADLEQSGQTSEVVRMRVKLPIEKVVLKRVRHLFQMREKTPTPGFSLELEKAPRDQYRLLHTEYDGLLATSRPIKHEDISYQRDQRVYSELMLVAEVARYLNVPCLEVEDLITQSAEGVTGVLAAVNEFNELLYDWIIPRLFKERFQIDAFTNKEEYQVDLVKMPPDGFYEMRAKPEMVVREPDAGHYAEKSFHLDTYCFDSNPERSLFWNLLRDSRVDKIYFTGMLTHGQSDFYVQYIDPDSHAIRSYYPDFLVRDSDGKFIIVEVKGDHQIEAPTVLAKQYFATQTALASGMTYRIIKGTDATAGQYDIILKQDEEALRQYNLLS